MRSILIRLKGWLLRPEAGQAVGTHGPAVPPGWSTIDSYSELYRTIPQAHFPNQRAFVEGPLERYLQLVEAASGPPGARIMEHACASLHWFRDSERAQGRSTDWLEATADALVRARFSASGANDRYMIEVFEGRATHNYRASDGDND